MEQFKVKTIRILLITIYPIWFFLARTMVGVSFMFVIVISPVPILVNIIKPGLMMSTGPESESVGYGVGILSLICAPYITVFFLDLSAKLESYYSDMRYKLKLN